MISNELELDNQFSKNNLGAIYYRNGNRVGYLGTDEIERFWKNCMDTWDFVMIQVPKSLENRFNIFWKAALRKLGNRLEIYHVQHGVPLHSEFTVEETLYFISVPSAEQLLKYFDVIMSSMPENFSEDFVS